MIINITSETGETSTDSTVKPAPAKGKEKLPRWFNTIAATKKQINKMKKGGAQKAHPHKWNSKAPSNIEFTVQQRLDMVEIWQNAANRTGRKQGLAAKWGVNKTTVRR